MRLLAIKVPSKCLSCGAEWVGGHEVPGRKMKLGLRVFYDCGASMSIWKNMDYGCLILVKGCERIRRKNEAKD